jgi:hypothetical protein
VLLSVKYLSFLIRLRLVEQKADCCIVLKEWIDCFICEGWLLYWFVPYFHPPSINLIVMFLLLSSSRLPIESNRGLRRMIVAFASPISNHILCKSTWSPTIIARACASAEAVFGPSIKSTASEIEGRRVGGEPGGCFVIFFAEWCEKWVGKQSKWATKTTRIACLCYFRGLGRLGEQRTQ